MTITWSAATYINQRIERDAASDCWLWTATLYPNGYGRFNVLAFGKNGYAHRLSYTAHVGPIPDGLHIDHLCRTRRCVNPSHLEAVTPRENVLRRDAAIGPKAKMNACVRGHEFTSDNTYPTKRGGRVCKACSNDASRRGYARRAAARLAAQVAS